MIDEVNNRDKSLFVALAWSEKFPENMVLVHVKDILKLKPRIVFVAIKNGPRRLYTTRAQNTYIIY